MQHSFVPHKPTPCVDRHNLRPRARHPALFVTKEVHRVGLLDVQPDFHVLRPRTGEVRVILRVLLLELPEEGGLVRLRREDRRKRIVPDAPRNRPRAGALGRVHRVERVQVPVQHLLLALTWQLLDAPVDVDPDV
eukprot:3177855-Rhodomonas_salina.1